MKRHESLAPLSREHHTALILAQLLKKDAPAYKGMPTGNTGKIEYALKIFHDLLKEHFSKEEILINKVQHCHEDIQKMGVEIFADHQQLAEYFLMLNHAENKEDIMNLLGNVLEAHIRKEERVLFPLIEAHCPEDELAGVADLLH